MDLGKQIRQQREAKGWSQTVLAERAGTSQQTIDRIERGETEHSRATPAILKALGMSAFIEQPSGERILASPHALGEHSGTRKDLPVYASAEGGGGEMIIQFDAIEYVQRPEPLQNIKGGYAIYVVGDSMEPAYERGDKALVNPYLPPRPGSDVILFRVEDDNKHFAMLKRLVRVTSGSWFVRQWNPAEEFELKRELWSNCHVVVGKYSR